MARHIARMRRLWVVAVVAAVVAVGWVVARTSEAHRADTTNDARTPGDAQNGDRGPPQPGTGIWPNAEKRASPRGSERAEHALVAAATADASLTTAVQDGPGVVGGAGPVAGPAAVVLEVPRAPAPNAERERLLHEAALRVTQTGLCPEANEKQAARDALLAGFEVLKLPSATAVYAPELSPQALEVIREALGEAPARVGAHLGAPPSDSTPVVVVVYKDLRQLRGTACVNTSTYGYYDGAIHLSGNLENGVDSIRETLFHEFAHHALVTVGVRLPMWLSEGLAMHVAEERWWMASGLGLQSWLFETHLPFESLVPAFMHTADERYATHAYFQSLMMFRFVLARSGVSGLRGLVAELAGGRLHVDDAFTAGAQATGDDLEKAWEQWVRAQR